MSRLFPKCTPKTTPVGTPTASKADRTLADGLTEKQKKVKKKKKKKKQAKRKQQQQQEEPLVVVDNIIDLSSGGNVPASEGNGGILVPPSVFRHDMNQMLNPTTPSSSSLTAPAPLPTASSPSLPQQMVPPTLQSTRIVGLTAASAQQLQASGIAIESSNRGGGAVNNSLPYSSGSTSSSVSGGDVRVTPVEARKNRFLQQQQPLRDTKIEIAGKIFLSQLGSMGRTS